MARQEPGQLEGPGRFLLQVRPFAGLMGFYGIHGGLMGIYVDHC